MRNSSRLVRSAFLILAMLTFVSPVSAEDWPTRAVTVVMPYKAGGGGETLVRIVMNKVSQTTGNTFIIENRPGAGGTIGVTNVAKERPDGYTLLGSGIGSSVVAPNFLHVSFDAMKDLTHIAYFGGPPPALAVTASFPAKTLQEYLELARKRPAGIAYASSGFGTHVHLMAELFKSITGANMLHVPYNGGGPAVADLIAGHVPSAMVSFGSVAGNVRNGQVRVLAVASAKRLKDYPDIPTFAELGYKEMTSVTWFGLSGPAGLPSHVVTKLNAEVRSAMANPDVTDKLITEGIEWRDFNPDEFTEFFRTEIARWSPIAKKIAAMRQGK